MSDGDGALSSGGLLDPLPLGMRRFYSSWSEFGLVVLALILVKSGWLLADATLRLYMGDSMVFMQSGAMFSGPGARSYPYGWALYIFAFPFKSPWAILLLQALWGILIGLGLFAFLRHALRQGFLTSMIPALLLATEPAQVFLERMVMAETFGLLAFVATFLLLSLYLGKGRLAVYLLACLAGLLAGALRTNMLPVVLGLCFLAPLVSIFVVPTSNDALGKMRHVASAVAILAVIHVAYMMLFGIATRQSAGYVAHTGMMRIGLVAPLIRPEHFEGTGVSGSVLDEVQRPLSDHWQRGHHIWAEDGLWHVLEKHTSEPEKVARIITRRAMLDDPVGLLKINLETLSGYFDEDKVYWRMQDDIGVIPPNEVDIENIKVWLDWDANGISRKESFARRYFVSSAAWLTWSFLLLAPLALLALLSGWRSGVREQYLLLALATWGLVASHLLFAHIVSFRYLHPMPWFFLANAAVVASWAFSRIWCRMRTVVSG